MELTYAFLANSAEMSSDGKLYLMGADFNRLLGTYPLTLQSMSLIVKMVFPPEECNREYHFSAEFIAPDGSRLEPYFERNISPSVPDEPDRKSSLIILLAINGMTFPTAGTYDVRVLLDGEEKKNLRLYALEVPQKNAENQSA